MAYTLFPFFSKKIIIGATAEPVSDGTNSRERFFTHKLVVYKRPIATDGDGDGDGDGEGDENTPIAFKSSTSNNDLKEVDDDYCPVYIMYNEMCILTAPSSLAKEVKSIRYEENLLKANDKIHGKRKKGALRVRPGATVAVLTYIDDTEHTLKTSVGGSVFEINENVITRPQLIQEERVGEGYIAVIYPKTKLPQLTHHV